MSVIFISYARKDARELAVQLHTDLIAAGHTPWLDTAEIEGGADWARKIEQAVERCDVALLLLSDGSYQSEICRAEQTCHSDPRSWGCKATTPSREFELSRFLGSASPCQDFPTTTR